MQSPVRWSAVASGVEAKGRLWNLNQSLLRFPVVPFSCPPRPLLFKKMKFLAQSPSLFDLPRVGTWKKRNSCVKGHHLFLHLSLSNFQSTEGHTRKNLGIIFCYKLHVRSYKKRFIVLEGRERCLIDIKQRIALNSKFRLLRPFFFWLIQYLGTTPCEREAKSQWLDWI